MRRISLTLLCFLIFGSLTTALPTGAAFDPNDVYYPDQWYARQIGAPLAWEVTTSVPDVVVAVLDTGVDIYHPDLRNNIWRNPGEVPNDEKDNDGNGFIDDTNGWDFIQRSNDPRPDATPPFSRTALHHGTVIAGVIAAEGNNHEGIAGIAWRTRIMPLRVLDSSGQGGVDVVAEAVDYAVRNGADIINLSFVGTGYSSRLYSALRRAYEAGVLIVVAAGNDGVEGDLDQTPRYPVCFDARDAENWILGVSATDTLDQRSPTANIGRCVDIVAPGTGFFGTQVFDIARGLRYDYGGPWSGTSLAAPVVSGVAALVMAAAPALTPAEVTQVLLKSADDIAAVNPRLGGKFGVGRINASRALTGTKSPGFKPPAVSVGVGGRVVSVALSPREPVLKLISNSGAVDRSWPLVDAIFAGGGSVAVSENARATNEDEDAVRLSAIIRGEQRIVVGEGAAGRGRVRVYGTDGDLLAQWFAYDRSLPFGIAVASGDVFGDGEGAVIVAPLNAGGPHVRIFGRDGTLRSQFFAYDRALRAGYSLAAGDVTGDGVDEIIIAPTTRGLPLRVFTASGSLLKEWWPYPTYRGGVNVAAGDTDGDGRDEIAVIPTGAGGPQVRVFTGVGTVVSQFFAFDSRTRVGWSIAIGDTTSDGRDEIIAAPRTGALPEVRILAPKGQLLGQFMVYGTEYRAGVAVAVLR